METRMETEAPDAPEALIARVQTLTTQLEELGDPATRAVADELIAAIMSLYGEGLERIFEALDEQGVAARQVRDRLVDDGVVGSLLLIHDLYPIDLETRVREALASVRPYMESHGGNVELMRVQDGVAHLKLEGHCKGCPASASTLELTIKTAIEEAAPDLEGIEVEGVIELVPETPIGGANAFELPVVQSGFPTTFGGGDPAHAAAGPPRKGMPLPVVSGPPSWISVDGISALPEGVLAALSIDDAQLIVANIGGTLLAYRNACGWCSARLDDAVLDGARLTCPGCEKRFDLVRAGRSPDDDALQLEPVPLLRDGGGVQVALAT